MDVSQIASTWVSPESTTATAKASEPQELKEASQKFEALLLQQFLGQALKPLLHESLGSNAPGAHIYQHMLTETISSQLSREESFGFASLLQMQLMGNVESEPALKDSSKKDT